MIFFGSTLSWVTLITCVIINFVITNLVSLFYPKYNSNIQVMSSLSSSKNSAGRLYNILVIISGLLACILSFNFYITYRLISAPLSFIGASLIATFGVFTGIIGGMFNFNEQKIFSDRFSLIHTVSSAIGFTALTFNSLVTSLIFFKLSNTLIATICFILFFTSLLLNTLVSFGLFHIFKTTNVNLSGMWQRLLIISLYIPFILITIDKI